VEHQYHETVYALSKAALVNVMSGMILRVAYRTAGVVGVSRAQVVSGIFRQSPAGRCDEGGVPSCRTKVPHYTAINNQFNRINLLYYQVPGIIK